LYFEKNEEKKFKVLGLFTQVFWAEDPRVGTDIYT
jgi:hypothetical protein